MLQLALTRLVEIVGEAANRVSPQTQSRFPAVPWREAVATRHRITHGYDVVDHDPERPAGNALTGVVPPPPGWHRGRVIR